MIKLKELGEISIFCFIGLDWLNTWLRLVVMLENVY